MNQIDHMAKRIGELEAEVSRLKASDLAWAAQVCEARKARDRADAEVERLRARRAVVCTLCRGTGRRGGETCTACGGTGAVWAEGE